MERISKGQLFCIMMLFLIGSTPLFALGLKAKQDAWLVIIIAMLNGFALIWIYSELQKNFPTKNFVQIIIALLGKPLGIPLAFLYAYYFIESSILNFSEFGFLINMTFLKKTPFMIIISIFMIIVIYYCFLGLEVICRTSQIILPIVLFFIITIIILTFLSGQMDLKSLTPVLGNGIKPVLKAVYPDIVIVPFGESILFLMYWSFVNSKQIRKTSLLAIGLTGLIVTSVTIINISVLGTDYASSASVPLLEVIKTINIGDIITNLDAIGIIFIFIGGFYKALLNLFGGILALSTLFKIKIKWIIIPVCILTFWITMSSIPSLMFHRFIGWNVFAKNTHVIFQIIIPILLYLTLLLKKCLKN